MNHHGFLNHYRVFFQDLSWSCLDFLKIQWSFNFEDFGDLGNFGDFGSASLRSELSRHASLSLRKFLASLSFFHSLSFLLGDSFPFPLELLLGQGGRLP